MHADGRHPRPHRALPPCRKDENLLGSPPNRGGNKKETLTVVVVVGDVDVLGHKYKRVVIRGIWTNFLCCRRVSSQCMHGGNFFFGQKSIIPFRVGVLGCLLEHLCFSNAQFTECFGLDLI